MLISIIIPCYNEELVVNETYSRLTSVLQQIDTDYEMIFINDGSGDKTFELLSNIANDDKSVKIINFSRNFGHQCAVTAGINHCIGDCAVIIDADLQDPPEVIVDMLNIMNKTKANVVYGQRKQRKGENWFKLFTAKCFYRTLNKLSDVQFPVDTGDFRLIDRKVIDTFNNFPEKNKYIRGIISWMGYKQVPCLYIRDERFAGETKYPLKKMLRFATTGLLYFSKRPLQVASFLGFISVILGLIYAIVLLITKIFGTAPLVTGWTTLVLFIIFFGGVQLLTIGILGQYIGYLFDQSKDRPEYIIVNKVNFNEQPNVSE